MFSKEEKAKDMIDLVRKKIKEIENILTDLELELYKYSKEEIDKDTGVYRPMWLIDMIHYIKITSLNIRFPTQGILAYFCLDNKEKSNILTDRARINIIRNYFSHMEEENLVYAGNLRFSTVSYIYETIKKDEKTEYIKVKKLNDVWTLKDDVTEEELISSLASYIGLSKT